MMLETDSGLPVDVLDPKLLSVKKPLGRGAFAVVYSATYGESNKPVALKVLQPVGSQNKANAAQYERMFLREAACAKQLNHQNFVKCYGVVRIPEGFQGIRGVNGSTWGLIMELCEPYTTKSLIIQSMTEARRTYTNLQAYTWLEQVASALTHLHAMQPPIIHRDIKHENVLLVRQRHQEQQQQRGTSLGMGLNAAAAAAEAGSRGGGGGQQGSSKGGGGGSSLVAKLADLGLHVAVQPDRSVMLRRKSTSLSTRSMHSRLSKPQSVSSRGPSATGAVAAAAPSSQWNSSTHHLRVPRVSPAFGIASGTAEGATPFYVLGATAQRASFSGTAVRGVSLSGATSRLAVASTPDPNSQLPLGLLTAAAAEVAPGKEEQEEQVEEVSFYGHALQPEGEDVSREHGGNGTPASAPVDKDTAVCRQQHVRPEPAAPVAPASSRSEADANICSSGQGGITITPTATSDDSSSTGGGSGGGSAAACGNNSVGGCGGPELDARCARETPVTERPQTTEGAAPEKMVTTTRSSPQTNSSRAAHTITVSAGPQRPATTTSALPRLSCIDPSRPRTCRAAAVPAYSADGGSGSSGGAAAQKDAPVRAAGGCWDPSRRSAPVVDSMADGKTTATGSARGPSGLKSAPPATVQSSSSPSPLAKSVHKLLTLDPELMQPVGPESTSLLSAAGCRVGSLLNLLQESELRQLRHPSAEWVFGLTGQAGSCMYMAPEVYCKLPYNEKADVFSFAVLMYELLSRELLIITYFNTPKGARLGMKAPEDYTAKVCEGFRPPRPPCLSAGAWSLVQACWHDDPVQRPPMEEVMRRLQELREEEQAEATDPPGRWACAPGCSIM